MKIGFSTYALAWNIGVPGYRSPACPWSWREVLEAARRVDVRLVQIADNMPLHLCSDDELTELATTARDFKIELQIGIRGTDPSLIRRYVDICGKLNAVLLRTIITDEDIGHAKIDLTEIKQLVSERNITLAIENHGLHTSRQLMTLVWELNSPFIGICLDTVNSFSALECPSNVIDNLLPLAVNVHVKDFSIQRADHNMGFVVMGTPAGKGLLNIADLIERGRRHNSRLSYVLELWPPYTRSVEETAELELSWFNQSLAYLRQWMDGNDHE